MNLSGSFDWWVAHSYFNPFEVYAFPGIYLNYNSTYGIDMGVRLGLGLQLFVFENIGIYVEPVLNLSLVDFYGFRLNLCLFSQISAGIRYDF